MKKILLISFIATSYLLAASSVNAGESGFYVKANAGFSKLTKNAKVKSNNIPYLGAGVGYNLMENLRADLTFDHYINSEFNEKNIKTKAKINTIFVNGYVDLFDISITKLFIGAGVGVTRANTKSFITEPVNGSYVTNSKQQNNFSYAAYIGFTTQFAPSWHCELALSWRNLTVQKDNGSGFKGHLTSFGIRYDI